MQVGVRDDVVDFPPGVDPLLRKPLAHRPTGANEVPQPFSGVADCANPPVVEVPSELPHRTYVYPEREQLCIQ